MRTFRVGLQVEQERMFSAMRIGDVEIAIVPPATCVPGKRYVLEADLDPMTGTITEGSVVVPGKDEPLPVVQPTEQLRRVLAGEPVYVPPRAE